MKSIAEKSRVMTKTLKLAIIFLTFTLLIQFCNSIYHLVLNKEHTKEANSAKLHYIEDTISTKYKDVIEMINQLSVDSRTISMVYSLPNSENLYSKMIDLRETLRMLKIGQKGTFDIYMSVKQIDKTISSSGVMSNSLFFNKLLLNWDEDNLTQKNGIHIQPGITVSLYNIAPTECNFVTYNNNMMMIIVALNQEWHDQLLRDVLKEDNSVAIILNSNFDIMCESIKFARPESCKSIDEYIKFLSEQKYNSEFKFECICKDGLYYIVGFDQSTPALQTVRFNIYIWITTIICFVFIGVYILILKHEIYQPIRNIINKLDIGKLDIVKDEYYIIDHAISDLSSRLGLLSNQLYNQDEMYLENLINKLLMGINVDDSLKTLSLRHDVNDYYLILTAVFEDNDGKINKSLIEHFEDLLFEHYIAKLIHRTGKQQSYYISTGFVDGIPPELISAIEELAVNGFAVFGLSRTFNDIKDIRIAFEQSHEVFYQPLLSQPSDDKIINVSGKFDKIEEYAFDINMREESVLLNSVKNGDKNALTQALIQIFNNNKELPIIRQRDLHIYIINLLKIRESSNDPTQGTIHHSVEKLHDMYNISRMNQFVINDYLNAVDTLSYSKYNLLQTITDYLNENYNKDIYLQKVAEEVNMSYAYVSRYLKKSTGMSFVEFLSSMRVEKAKVLLYETDIAIGKIAAMVGFDIVNTFIKTFKKYTGITPGEYRKMNITREKIN